MADDVYNITNNQYLGNGEKDSAGNPLPGDFYGIPSSNTYTWTGTGSKFPNTKTEVKVLSGVGTFTRITTYTNDGTNVTGRTVGSWVKS